MTDSDAKLMREWVKRTERHTAALNEHLDMSKCQVAAHLLRDKMAACLSAQVRKAAGSERSAEDGANEHVCVGWPTWLWNSLWRMVRDDDGGRNTGNVSAEDVAELRRLHEACGGWWHWDADLGGEMFVPTEEWLRMCATQQEEQA